MPTKAFFSLSEKEQARIVETAYEAFAAEIFERASIREISRRLDMAVGSFYRYFESKDDLYLYVIDWKFGENYQRVLPSPDKSIKLHADEEEREREARFWENFHGSSSEIRKKYYFRVKNNILFSLQHNRINSYDTLDADAAVAASFVLAVLPYLMRELSDLTQNPVYDGDFWIKMKNIFVKGILAEEKEA